MQVDIPYDEVRNDVSYVERFMDSIDAEAYDAGRLNYRTDEGHEILITEKEDGLGILGDEQLVPGVESILRSRIPWLRYRLTTLSYRNSRAVEEFRELFDK